jgi:uncharacterized protein (TIGR02147 family)
MKQTLNIQSPDIDSSILSHEKPIIYDFKDYHQFVAAMVVWLKKSDPSFSFRRFSKRAGLASSSFLLSVATQKKGLSESSVRKLSVAFDLDLSETHFFLKLLRLKKVRLPSDKKLILEQLVTDRAFCQRHPLAAFQYRFYSKWYYTLIRELVVMGCSNRTSIHSYLGDRVTYNEMELAIEDLKTLGLIKENEKFLEVCNQILSTDSEVVSEVFKLFQSEMLVRAQKAMIEMPRELRDMRSATFSINKEDFPALKAFLELVTARAIQHFESRRTDRDLVLQLNLQAFPL